MRKRQFHGDFHYTPFVRSVPPFPKFIVFKEYSWSMILASFPLLFKLLRVILESQHGGEEENEGN